MSTPLAWAWRRRLGVGLDVEAEHDGVRRGGEHHVRLGHGAHRAVDDLELDLVGGEPLERLGQRLHRALHVGLEDEPQLLDLARLDLLVQVLQGDAGRALALEPVALAAHGGDLPRLALVGRPPAWCRPPAARRRGRGSRPDRTGPRSATFLPRSLNIARTRPECEPTTTASPSLSVPDWMSAVATGPRPAVEPAFHDDPARGPAGIGAQLEDLGLQRGHLQQLRDAVAALGRGVDEDGLPAPVLGHEAVVGRARA